MSRAPVVTIDGPAGAGKGTVARTLAQRLSWHLLDSGAIYRLLALASLRQDVEPTATEQLVALAAGLDIEFPTDGQNTGAVLLDGEVVSDAIREESTGVRASELAAIPAVRKALLSRQRDFRAPPGLIADGRDMGTVVFPQASLKIFLTASPEERARRRHKQLIEQGVDANLRDLLQDMRARDERDSQRSIAPLKAADDALIIDSTAMPVEAVIEQVMARLDAVPKP